LLKKLSTFIAVAENGSFTKAAHVLFMSQSAVSQQMAALERSVGAALFERGEGGLELTESGRYLLANAKPLIGQMQSVLARTSLQAEGSARGHLSLLYRGEADDPVVVPLLAALLREHPALDVRLERFAQVQGGVAAVARGDVDAAFGKAQLGAADLSLAFTQLCATYAVCAMPAGHPLSQRASVEPDDLLDLPLVLLEDRDPFDPAEGHRGSMRHQDAHNDLRRRHRKPELLRFAADTRAALTLVKAGAGTTVLDSGWVVADEGVACVPFEGAAPCAFGYFNSLGTQNPAVAWLAEAARSTFAPGTLLAPGGRLVAP
jgi:DNA-binding transcriptional LysR family regulator